jgi:phage protein D
MPVDIRRTPSSLFGASRPTFRVDGAPEARLNTALIDLMVEETSQGLYRCEARFGNWGPSENGLDFLFFDADILDFGKAFAVDVGEARAAQPIFNGRIMGIEAQYPDGQPPQIVILAEDRFQDLRMTRHTRSFNNVSIGDVVQEIATDHGLEANIALVENEPVRETLAQLNRSDLAFLRELATAVDAETWVEEETLYFQARAIRNAEKVSLSYGKNLREFTVLADLAHQRSSVGISGWDVAGKEPIYEEADKQSIAAELNGLLSGSDVLDQALGPRNERIVLPGASNREEASLQARVEYRRRARRFVCGSGLADGLAKLRVGSHVELTGLGSYFDGTYYAHLVRHAYDAVAGYRTFFEVHRPGIGKPS